MGWSPLQCASGCVFLSQQAHRHLRSGGDESWSQLADDQTPLASLLALRVGVCCSSRFAGRVKFAILGGRLTYHPTCELYKPKLYKPYGPYNPYMATLRFTVWHRMHFPKEFLRFRRAVSLECLNHGIY